MSKTFYAHIRPNKHVAKGGALTIAYKFDESSNQVKYAVARCGDSDHFNRSQGRAIAESRLNRVNVNNNVITYIPVDGRVPRFSDAVNAIVTKLKSENNEDIRRVLGKR